MRNVFKLLPLAMAISLTAEAAAPGGVSTPSVWVRSDSTGADINHEWPDMSGNGNHLEAISDHHEKWCVKKGDEAHNFQPYLTGFEHDRYFRNYDTDMVPDFTTESPLTIFAVTYSDYYASGDKGRITGLDSTSHYGGEPGLSLSGTGGAGAGELLLRAEKHSGYGMNVYHPQPVELNGITASYAVIGGSDNRSVTLSVNGQTHSATLHESSITRGDNIVVGYGTKDSGDAFSGDIMEVIWYNRELNAEELERVSSYLAMKYGVNGSDRYYDSYGDVVWDAAENTGFTSNLFSLVRDDESSLDVRISGEGALMAALDNDFTSANNAPERITTFPSDMTYVFISDNGEATDLSTDETAEGYGSRVATEWLVHANISFPEIVLQFDLPVLADGAEVYLVKKSYDHDFSGGIEVVGQVDTSTGIIEYVQLEDGDYFTLMIIADRDGDGVDDSEDAFPDDASEWEDTDGDGIGNNADEDDDNDGFSDAEEETAGTDPLDASSFPNDRDGDGVSDEDDAFPDDASEWEDTDGDNIGNNADEDDDNDGYTDTDENDAGSDPLNPNSVPADNDEDGVSDVNDNDDDNDGVNDEDDAFPMDETESEDTDGDNIGNNADEDDDGDGYTDTDENDAGSDPLNPNSVPGDNDGDGVSDVNDNDDDNDGVNDEDDAFPMDSSEWEDTDGDNIGNNADNDDDGDGYTDSDESDAGSDPLDPNSVPADNDKDGISDVNDNDDDNDGVNDEDDAFPMDETESEDTDGDNIGNNADNDDDGDGYTDTDENDAGSDPRDPNSVPADNDDDGVSDVNDNDDDNDGVNDEDDAFPMDETESEDTDGDNTGNNADNDDDGDGYSDEEEAQAGSDPLDPESVPSDNDDDGISDVNDNDDDNDGVNDEDDAFPLDESESEDTDGDNTGNNADTDDDNDGYSDEEESDAGSDPLDPNSVPADDSSDASDNSDDSEDDSSHTSGNGQSGNGSDTSSDDDDTADNSADDDSADNSDGTVTTGGDNQTDNSQNDNSSDDTDNGSNTESAQEAPANSESGAKMNTSTSSGSFSLVWVLSGLMLVLARTRRAVKGKA